MEKVISSSLLTKNARKSRTLAFVVALLMLVQFMPSGSASAATGIGDGSTTDLTGTGYLSVHGTDYDPPEQASSIAITDSDGNLISPDASGNYSDIPSGAKIVLNYAFSLEDGNADAGVFYNYDGGDYFTATLPGGLQFQDPTSGTITAHDATYGIDYDLATWTIPSNSNILTVTLTAEAGTDDPSSGNDKYQARWGVIQITGTFETLHPGDSTTQEITFGSQTITIDRQPLPMVSTLTKSGVYDASTNEITWTVTVTPPAGAPDMSYDGYTLIDEYDSNQDYVDGSFKLDGTVQSSGLSSDAASRTISYTFPDTNPDTTGSHTFTYKTTPNTFAAEGVAGTEYSTYNNTASLKRVDDPAADPVTGTVTLNWINKTGAMVDTSASDPTVAKWTVDVTVPGTADTGITGATITDILGSDKLEFLTDEEHPVQIQFGTVTAENVDNGAGEGQYSVSGDTLTYKFPAANQPTAGTTARLTYYTHVSASYWSDYLNNNSGISFANTASLHWNENTTGTTPSDSYTISNGIGGGGLISKSGGSRTNYTYSASDPGTIYWTVTVNRNKINMNGANISDAIPANQELLIDGDHPLTVTKVDDSSVTESITSPETIGNFTYTNANSFTYTFPSTISSTYTVDYYTRITDLSSLYSNRTITNIYTDSVTLVRDLETNVSFTGDKQYNSQMIAKTVKTAYDYNSRTVQWQIVVNRNKLPLTNAVVTDTLPDGMTLLIDGEHEFSVISTGSDTGSLTGSSGDTSFTYTLPTTTSDQYTITFWSKMSEETLKAQWSNTKDFRNTSSLVSDEITTAITSTAKVSIINPVISKAYSYADKSDTIYWSVVINPAQVNLHDGAVEDTLNSSLMLDPDSVKLYTATVDGTSGEATSTGTEVTKGTSADADNYAVTLPTSDNGNKLTVTLPTDTSSAYILEFATVILTDDIDLSNTVNLTGSSSTGNSTSSEIVVNDLYSSGGSGSNTLTVHKTDAGGNPVAGATFKLLNANKQQITKDGNPITAVTGPSGNAVFNALPSWIFYVEETDPAPGYLLPSDAADRIFGDGSRLSGTETISATNSKALGSLSFSKVNSSSGIAVSGGTFTLTGVDYAGNDVSLSSTSVNGTVTFDNIPLGSSYTIKETVPPSGYYLSATELTASVVYTSDKTDVITSVTPDTISDKPVPISSHGSVKIIKTDEEGAKLSGAVFTLYNSSGTAIASEVSDDNGYALFRNLELGAAYTIKETTAPEGYDLSTDVISFNVTSDTVLSYTVVNKKTVEKSGNISILKTDENGNVLPGAEFTLYDKDGNVVGTAVTKADGTAEFTDIPAGDYTVAETLAPIGYTVSESSRSVTVKSGDTVSLTILNKKENAESPVATGTLKIAKVDEEYHPLSGAVFTLYDSDGSIIGKAVSGSDGIAIFEGLVPGSYSVKETVAPEGYVLFSDSLEFEIPSEGITRSFTLKNTKNPEEDPDVAGWSDDDGGGSEPLPQTGGIPYTFYMLLAGLGMILMGVVITKPKRKKGRHEK